MSDAYCPILFIRGERDRGRDTEGDEETDNMKASLDSRGFNLSQKAYPRTQIRASRCECRTYCTFGNEKDDSRTVSSRHRDTSTICMGKSDKLICSVFKLGLKSNSLQ